MGDPKFPRRRYDTPSHPWDGDRIQAEKAIVRKYGLKNKREVWKAQTKLRTFRGTARNLLSQLHTPSPQVKKESGQLLSRMNRLGFLSDDATLDDILGLDVEQILGRRLQTVVYLKGLASTPKQARQFITHGHITVGGRRVTVPSHLVTLEEQETIEFGERSAVHDPSHPVRARPDEFAPRSEPEATEAPAAPPAKAEAVEEPPAEAEPAAAPAAEEAPAEDAAADTDAKEAAPEADATEAKDDGADKGGDAE